MKTETAVFYTFTQEETETIIASLRNAQMIISRVVQEPTVTPTPAPTIPAPPPAVTPIPPMAASEFGVPDANGVQSWTFLASLANEWCPAPVGIIAKFAAAGFILPEGIDRAVQMNTGANAQQKSNLAFTIVPTNPIRNPWDYANGVRWRQHDIIPGVVTFQDEIGTTGRSTRVTAEVAAQMLRGRLRGMELSGNLRHWQRLGIDDYRRGA